MNGQHPLTLNPPIYHLSPTCEFGPLCYNMHFLRLASCNLLSFLPSRMMVHTQNDSVFLLPGCLSFLSRAILRSADTGDASFLFTHFAADLSV